MWEKASWEALGGGQEGDCCGRVERSTVDIKTGAGNQFQDESGECPLIGQAVSGIEATRA